MIQKIVTLPYARLRKRSKPIGHVGEQTLKLIADMEESTLAWEDGRDHEVGVALAAIQIDVSKRVVIIRNNFDNKQDRTFEPLINPEVVNYEGEPVLEFEGCLSVKNVYGKVPRYPKVHVRAKTIENKVVNITAEGFLARVLQHEIDHLNGLLFVDRIKDTPEAFYQINAEGKIEDLNEEERTAIFADIFGGRHGQYRMKVSVNKKLVFFGNERIATGVETDVSILQALISEGYEIEALVISNTQARSRKQRKLKIIDVAKKHDIPIHLPTSSDELLKIAQTFKSDAAVLVAYGRMVPQPVIELFSIGIINVHPSLLPSHRGSIPIESAILKGDTKTGVSIMKLVREMDAGPVYGQTHLLLSGTETKESLAKTLIQKGQKLLLELLPDILDATSGLEPATQDDTMATYDQRIVKGDGVIDWGKDAPVLEREIRAYAGWPRSRTNLGSVEVVITKAHVMPGSGTARKPGDLLVETKGGCLAVVCGDGNFLCVEQVIPAGKKEMPIDAFLRGYASRLVI